MRSMTARHEQDRRRKADHQVAHDEQRLVDQRQHHHGGHRDHEPAGGEEHRPLATEDRADGRDGAVRAARSRRPATAAAISTSTSSTAWGTDDRMWVNRRPAEEPEAQFTPALSVDSDEQAQRDQEDDQRHGRRQIRRHGTRPEGRKASESACADGHQRGPEVRVGRQGGDDRVRRPTEPGRWVHLLDAPDEEEARRADEEEGQGIAADVLGELDVQAGSPRTAARRATRRAGRTASGPSTITTHNAPTARITDRLRRAISLWPNTDPSPQQQVVERHVRLAVRDHVGEAVPGRRGQRRADGLVEEEAVGTQEQRTRGRPRGRVRRATAKRQRRGVIVAVRCSERAPPAAGQPQPPCSPSSPNRSATQAPTCRGNPTCRRLIREPA